MYTPMYIDHMLSKTNQVGDIRDGTNACGVFVSATSGLVSVWITESVKISLVVGQHSSVYEWAIMGDMIYWVH